VVFTHNSGESMTEDNLFIINDGDRSESPVGGEDDEFSAGSTITEGNPSGTVSLVYDDGSASSTLASVDVDDGGDDDSAE
jgi:hypothetical protein